MDKAIWLLQNGRPHEAIALLHEAVKSQPRDPALNTNLGIAHEDCGDLKTAERYYRGVLEDHPYYVEAVSNLGNLLARTARLDEAETMHRYALELRANDAYSMQALGFTLCEQGRIEEAIDQFRRASAILQTPDAESLVLSYGLHLGYDEQGHREWKRRFVPDAPAPPKTYDGSRKLRVGYLSSKFNQSATASMFEPVIVAHDRDRLHLTLYADSNRQDEATHRFKRHADVFRFTAHLNHPQLADLIRADNLDVLVYLDGHKVGSRLLALGQQLAPVAGTMNGYPAPTHVTDDFNVGQWAYRPADDAPPVLELPFDKNGYITFGSFNRVCKLTREVLAAWATVLNRLPTARMKVNAPGGPTNTAFVKRLEAAGMPMDRVEVVRAVKHHGTYLGLAGTCDIHLDPWPYNGTTTTCDLLWQGMPVVTRQTDDPQGEVGAQILSAVGLSDLIAGSEAEYVETTAVRLAGDVGRLRDLRANLRDRMRALTDGRPLAKRLEELYSEKSGGAEPMTFEKIVHGAVGLVKAGTGIDRASEETIVSRAKICEGCDHNKAALGLFPQCEICKCALAAKIRIASEKCPAGKW